MSQQQQDYDMDRQHLSPGQDYSDRTPTATEPNVDLLSNLSDPSTSNQISYPELQPNTHAGPPREYQSLSSFQHGAYRQEHMPSMAAAVPRYAESIQRTSQPQHHQIGLYSYSPTTSYPDMSGSIHSNPTTSSGRGQTTAQRYPISTDLYSSDTRSAPASGGYRQVTSGVVAVPSLDNIRLTDPMVANYRQSMTSYHRRESESLQRRQRPEALSQLMAQDRHAAEHTQAHNPYSQTSPVLGGINSRRSTIIPDIYLDERAQHGQQRHSTPLEYEMAADAQSAGQYSGSVDDSNVATSGVLGRPANASGLMQFGDDSFSANHASSSIPMSNSHPRPLFAGDASSAQLVLQQQYQPRDMHALSPDAKRQEGQHQSRVTHLKQTPQSQRQRLHTHQQRYYQQPHSPNPDTGDDLHHSTQRGSSHRSRLDDPLHIPRPEHTYSAPHAHTVDRSHSNPRSHSMPGPPTSSHMLRPSSSLLSKSISPLSNSDNESGTESNMLEDDERTGIRTRRSGKGREDDFLRGRSYDSSGAMVDQEDAQDESTGGQSRSGDQGEGQSEPPKKRKKSKMHECEVCQKKFPRPSGLKTHMNTHSNEKPFPCGFPGCTRTFGVRSNAKRHLRTHGIIPSSASSTVTETPYVVDFSTPLIMPPHPSNISIGGPGSASSRAGGSSTSGAEAGDERANNAESGMLDDIGTNTDDLAEGNNRDRGQSSRSAFKLRWMPLSLTSRSNATALRSAQDAGMLQRMDRRDWVLDGGQWNAELRQERGESGRGREPRGSRMELADEAREIDMNFDDAAMAARLSIPLEPVLPSHASSSPVGDNSDASISHSSSGLSLMGPGDSAICMCNPQCPPTSDGLVRCRNGGALSFASLSPANAPTSPPSGPSSSASFASGDNDYQEERNSYLPTGSHPYHSSQFCGVLPGPAILGTVAGAPLRV